MKFELRNEAADAVGRIAEITDRNKEQVVTDAIRTYLWLLHEQHQGKRFLRVAPNGNLAEIENLLKHQSVTEVAKLIKNDKAAHKYFVAW